MPVVNSVESEYENTLLSQRKDILDLGVIQTIFVWIACLIMDWLVYPDLMFELWSCRLVYISVLVYILYISKLKNIEIPPKLYTFILAVGSSITISIMIYLTGDTGTPYVFGLLVNTTLLSLIFGIRSSEITLYSITFIILYIIPIFLMKAPIDWDMVGVAVVHFIFILNYNRTQSLHYFSLGLKAFVLEKQNNEFKLILEQRNRELELRNKELLEKHDLLIQAAKMASVGELTAMLMHQIRNPLGRASSTIAYYYMLKEDGEISLQDIEEMFTSINDSLNSISMICSDLTMFTYAEKEQHREWLDLKNIISKSFRIAIDSSSKVKYDIICGDVKILAIENQIIQVFVNLINNSLSAFKTGGEASIKISVGLSSDNIEILYRDYGPGVHEDIVKRLFEVFVTSKSKGQGTGLGLRICQMIVESHKGSIKYVGNQPGATFMIKLPIR